MMTRRVLTLALAVAIRIGAAWLDDVRRYEKKVLAKRK